MAVDMSQFYQVFFEETGEHLANMESLLLALDVAAPTDDDLNAIFRCAHSIKGGAGTFGFSDMADVTHVLETLLDKIRKHELQLTAPMVDAFLRAGDVIRGQLGAHRGEGVADPDAATAVCATLEALCNSEAQPGCAAELQPTIAKTILTICFSAPADDSATNLLAELQALGEVEVVKRPRPRKTAPVKAGKWVLKLTSDASSERIRELVEFVAVAGTLKLEQSSAPASRQMPAASDGSYGFFDNAQPDTVLPVGTPAASGDVSYGFFTDLAAAAEPASANEGDSSYGFFTDLPVAQPPTPTIDAAPSGPAHPPHGRRATDRPEIDGGIAGRRQTDKAVVATNGESSIRVSIDKVDKLINLVGELVITQSMLAQTASQVNSEAFERLHDGLNQLERNTRDLQESVMSIRMLPISFVFSRFPRVVRDVAGKLGKDVELKTVGEGTELDKGVIEKIADPLTHLVRNSLDHGIEMPQARLAAGKPARGTVTLRAYHQGGNIMVEVSDDGRGLNRERILAKATERGMTLSENMSDQEVFKLIFAPGFSTADVVTDVSGRGVGMDVVKRNIEAMGGGVEIDSFPGQGTRITIRLPLTLAILDGLSVRVGKEIYIVPLTYIVESLQPNAQDIRTVAGNGLTVQVRGDYLPVLSAARIFNVGGECNPNRLDQNIMVIVEAEGQRMALAVDDLVGQHQVVIKSLETNYRRVHGVSGATIMGDGRVALILDVAGLVRLTRARERLAA